jgi:hypothetical protein
VNAAANQKPTAVTTGSATTATIAAGESTTTIALKGDTSSDPDGDTMTYAWTCKTQPAGATVSFSDDGKVANSTATVDKKGEYTFNLVVTDSNGAASSPAAVSVSVAQKVNKTKDVSVGAISVTKGTSCTSINFTPDLTATDGWDSNFAASDITYTLADDTRRSMANGDFSGGIVDVTPYADGEYHTITQTFYYAGNSIGTRTVVLEITNAGGANYISDLYDNTTDYAQVLTAGGTKVPGITLTPLSKEISE